MAQTSLILDAETLKVLGELKDTFGVKTNAAVIRRALALARIAAQNADEDRVVTIVDRQNVQKKVILAG